VLTQDHGSRPLRVPSPSLGRVSGQGMQGRSEGSRGKVKGEGWEGHAGTVSLP
jgi:hypothetical protein